MSTVSFEVPESVSEAFAERSGVDPARVAYEAFLVEGVRHGAISRGYFRDRLGLSFDDGEKLLADRGVVYDISEEELRREIEGFRRATGRS